MLEQFKSCIDYFKHFILNDIENLNIYCWVAGGAVRDYFSIGWPTSDIDLFFTKEIDANIVCDWIEKEKGILLYKNNNVSKYKFRGKTIDIVRKYFASPIAAIGEFDFTVACAGVDKDMVYHHDTFFMDLAKKRLVINKLPYPLSTLQRLQKYILKGYRICNGGLLDISKAISELDLSNPGENTFEFYPDGKAKFIKFD